MRWTWSAILAATTSMFVLLAAGVKAAEVPTLETAQVLGADPKDNWFAVFAPDGKTLAAGGAGGVLKLWDLASRGRSSEATAA
jgi:hypothetical protein